QISCVLAEDGRCISSTRIYRGEIDVHGNLIR
ncbi:MAG TPA: phosphopantetheine adenylyltransferase, partial [Methanoregula sp.]|nr:phosphopantetheine adenylyltransferase [Methanoregula sp.]